MRRFFIFFLVFNSAAHLLYSQQEEDVIKAVDKLLLNSRFREAIRRIDYASGESPSILLENKKAEALTRLGNYEEAEELLAFIQSKLTLQPDAFINALTATNAGFLQLSQGRSDRAEATLQKALHAFDVAGKGHSLEAARALSHLGIAFMTRGKYSQAQGHLHRALSLRESASETTDEWIAASYNNLGLVYSRTDKNKALAYYKQAQEMYTLLYSAQHPKIAIANINTGIIYRDLELFDDAVNNFEHALKIWKAVYTEPHPAKGITLYNLGQTYLGLNNRKTAMEYYTQALKMYEECYGPRHPEIASVLNAIGNLQVAELNFDEALQTYQRSLQANVRDFNDSDVQSNPALKNYYNGTGLLHTLMFKAQAFESRYLRRSLKFSDLTDALGILTKCDSLIDMLRHQSSNESDKLLLGAMANEVYGAGVRIAYQAGLNSLRKAHYFEKGFYFAEKSKGAVLLESISDTRAKNFAGIPEDLLEEEKEIKSALALTGQKLAGKPSPEEEKALRKSTFALNRQYERFIEKLEHNYPEYFNLKFNAAIPSVQDIQKLLNEKTAVISYALDEKNHQLYIFLIRKNHFRVWQRPLTKDFDRNLTGLRNSLYFTEINTFRESASALGRTLLPPIPGSITDLIILPTGRLALIPFETLLADDAQKIRDYRSLPYLITRFNVRYEFSAGLLLQKGKTDLQPDRSRSIFLCAPVTFSGRQLSELPGTEKEVKDIAMLFSEKKFSVTACTGRDAGEDRIKNGQLKDYRFIHFATHGVVDEASPDLSRIFLQPGAAQDGDLFAGEIYNLELNANLVTLSACQTGLGKVYKGEGVIGLSRALVYAGARNIIVSFWNVADESTALLMKDFYQGVLETPSAHYSENLRQAKLKLLRNEKYAAPFYWAPFVLIGF